MSQPEKNIPKYTDCQVHDPPCVIRFTSPNQCECVFCHSKTHTKPNCPVWKDIWKDAPKFPIDNYDSDDY